MYAYTSTPGTSPPANPYFRATASSWILFADLVAMLWARTWYSSTIYAASHECRHIYAPRVALGAGDLVLCSGTLPTNISFAERLQAATAGGFRAISLWARDYERARAAVLTTPRYARSSTTTGSSSVSSIPPGGGCPAQPT